MDTGLLIRWVAGGRVRVDPEDSGFNVRPGPDVAGTWHVAGPVRGPRVRGPSGIGAGFGSAACAWGGDLGAFLQHTPVSVSGVGVASASGAGMYSGGMSTGQFMTRARSVRNLMPCRGLVKKSPIMSSVTQCLTDSHPWSSWSVM